MKFEEFTELLVDCMKARLAPNDSGIQIKTDKILKITGDAHSFEYKKNIPEYMPHHIH